MGRGGGVRNNIPITASTFFLPYTFSTHICSLCIGVDEMSSGIFWKGKGICEYQILALNFVLYCIVLY